MQPASPLHPLGHIPLVPWHTYGAHDGLCPAVPAPTTVHVPICPATSHRSHPSPQTLLQQYPSAHCPDAHSRHPATAQSVCRLHDCPSPLRGWHVPPTAQ